MKIISEPEIYLIGRQVYSQEVIDKFLEDHDTFWETDTEIGSEVLSEMAGRLCYMSFGKKKGRKTNSDYLQNIITSQHGSVLEHSVWNFILCGVSRSLTHELVRHRAGFGYSQLSQRYVDESDTNFVIPDIIDKDPDLKAKWTETIKTAQKAYCDLADMLMEKVPEMMPELKKTSLRKVVRQTARSVLPNATETKIFITGNARAIRHFIEMRAHPAADLEIRKVAVRLLKIMQEESPNIFGDYGVMTLPDGTEGVEVLHRKV